MTERWLPVTGLMTVQLVPIANAAGQACSVLHSTVTSQVSSLADIVGRLCKVRALKTMLYFTSRTGLEVFRYDCVRNL